MPIFETTCVNPECELFELIEEHYYRHFDDPNPFCRNCGYSTDRVASNFGIVFTGALTTKYNDKSLEGAYQEGHWAYRKNNTKSGKPERVFIDTFDAQRQFCKDEGLVNPKDLGNNCEITADGKAIRERGMKGQWV